MITEINLGSENLPQGGVNDQRAIEIQSISTFENRILRERNLLEALFRGDCFFNTDSLTNPTLSSENPSYLYILSKLAAGNQKIMTAATVGLASVPAVTCAFTNQKEVCVDFQVPILGVALTAMAFIALSPRIRRYLDRGDVALRQLREHRNQLIQNQNSDQLDSRAESPAPAQVQDPAPAPAQVQDPAPAPAQVQDPAPAQVQVQDPALAPALVPAQVQVQDPATILASLENIYQSITNSIPVELLTTSSTFSRFIQTFMAGQGPQNSEERPSGEARRTLAYRAQELPQNPGPDWV